MQIPLFENVVMSIMVEHLFAFVASSALMPIFVTFGYTFVDGCTLTSYTSSSYVSFCVAYASTDCCSTPLSLSNFSMYTRSIGVAFGPAYSLELQPFLHLHKKSISNVLDMYIS